jgi:hypothetical protein
VEPGGAFRFSNPNSVPLGVVAMTATRSLGELIAQLKQGEVSPLPANESWAELIARISVPHHIMEVSGETYDYFLDVLPPRWMGAGSGFAFGEGDEELRLLWTAITAEGRQYFCRKLDPNENIEFCKLARISLSSG